MFFSTPVGIALPVLLLSMQHARMMASMCKVFRSISHRCGCRGCARHAANYVALLLGKTALEMAFNTFTTKRAN